MKRRTSSLARASASLSLSAALAGGLSAQREQQLVLAEVAKAHATRKLARRVKWRGCDISIENDKGSVRRGVDRDGHAWENVIQTPYGYFKGSQTPSGGYSGGDGEHLDVLVKEHDAWESCPVFVIHQRKAGTRDQYDEDKVVLGCLHESEAKQAYLDNYDAHGKDLIGAISKLAPEQLEAHLKGGRENWGRPLVHNARQKIMLRQHQIRKAEEALEERREWLRGVVEVLKAGGPFDEEDLPDIPGLPRHREDPITFYDPDEVQKALAPVLLAEQAMTQAAVEVIADVEKAAGAGEGRRLLKIIPSFECIDLQNQLTTKDTIREAWPYYELAGNVDLEHLTKKGGKTYEEYRAVVKAQGFEVPEGMDEAAGRNYFEVGRPVRGSFDSEECSFIAEIYKGHPVADWLWSTLTEVTPAWQWKPSIGGAAKLAEVVAENPDPIFGRGRTQKFEVLRQFRFNNVGLTIEPVCHYVAPAEVVRGEPQAISKGLDVEFEETPMTNCEMTKATDVLKAALMDSAQAVLADMLDSGQLSQNEALSLTAEIAKALEPIEAEAEVVKALDYGSVTTDSAAMTNGQAFTREGLSEREAKRRARELKEDTDEGLTPFQKGFEWSEDPVVDVTTYLMDDAGYSTDDALQIAKAFFGLLTKAG